MTIILRVLLLLVLFTLGSLNSPVYGQDLDSLDIFDDSEGMISDIVDGDVEFLSLEEAIELARENSPQARTAEYSLIASQHRYQSYRADLLPGLSISGDSPNYRRSFRESFNPDGSTDLVYSQQSNANMDLSIQQPIMFTGGNVSISSGITRLGIFSDENTYLWSATPLVIGLNQPLFQFNNLKWRSRIEPLEMEISRKEYVESVENLSMNVTQRYFDVLLAMINLDIAETNVAVNDSIYNISQGRYNVGSIAENDVLQAELALRNAESSLTQSRLSYDQLLKEFRLLLGLQSDAPVGVEVPDEVPIFEVDREIALEMAQTNNSTALNFQLSETEARRNLDQAEKSASFSASIQANFGLNQTSSDFMNVYNQPLSQQFVTLNFQVPIFNWGKQQAEIQSARNTQRQVADQIAYQQAQFVLQVESTVAEFQQLRDQVMLAELSADIAERRYDVARGRYLIGRIDITNLLIAQNERDSARRSYIQSLRNYWSGVYDLRRLTLFDFEQGTQINHTL
ncbi:MAG: TolC family protein [Balneolaceae bacterium]